MTVTFLEPGGDGDFKATNSNGFWTGSAGPPTVSSSIKHGGHLRSIGYLAGSSESVTINVMADAGSRASVYLRFVALPSATASLVRLQSSSNVTLVTLRMTSAGILQLWNAESSQIGSDGATLSTAVWYRVSLAYTITSTSVNRFELFVDGVSSISITNATLSAVSTNKFLLGNPNSDSTLNYNSSDHYFDDSSALTDTGNIWVTAKRPNANGTTNGFSTQVGAGGSGYGTGHSPQVNERALSAVNGWSMVGAGSAVIEEYNIESRSTGDIDLTGATIVDWMGWISTKALVGETVNVIIDGASVAQAITSTNTIYKKIKGSSTYPSGTGADIGMQTDTSLTTVTLNECGVIVAYIPIQALTLVASQGSYALTGQTVTITRGYTLTAGTGSFALNGQTVGVTSARTISIATGSYSLTGQDVLLVRRYVLTAETGYYTMTGFDADLPFQGWTNERKSVFVPSQSSNSGASVPSTVWSNNFIKS